MTRIFLRTLIFLFPLYIPIILIGAFFGLVGALVGLIISVIICLMVIKNAEKIIFRLYKARQAFPGEFPTLREKIWLLSKRSGFGIPVLYLTELPLPGSFIIGRNMQKTALIMPGRLLKLLGEDELEATLAYNIVQINNNIKIRTLAIMVTGIFTLTVSAIRWGAVFTGFGDYDEPAPKLFGLFFSGLVAPPAAAMLHSVAEMDLDVKAASLCGNPAAFIMTMDKLEKNNIIGYQSLGFFSLVDPLNENFFEVLFKAHPPRETRVKNLMEGMEKT
jgi:Zn-dependent protease with chaperone function